jgi:hypothetical protein
MVLKLSIKMDKENFYYIKLNRIQIKTDSIIIK